MPVSTYVQEVGGPLDLPLEQQMRWVVDVCGQKIKFDANRPGVIVLDHADGRKRVRVGMSSLRETAEDTGFYRSIVRPVYIFLYNKNKNCI